AERASQGTGSDLHPYSPADQPLDPRILRFNPREPLRMGQYRDIASCQEVEKKLLQPHRRDMVRRLDQNVARIREGEKASGPEPSKKIRHHVHICTGHELEWNALPVERLLQCKCCFPDLGAGIVIEARQDVWRAGDNSYAVLDEQLRHLYRNSDVPCTIIHAG